jgi:hypothetical protein
VLQHLAEAAQKIAQYVLTPYRLRLPWCGLFLIEKECLTMELNHFTETFTVLNADGDFRRMLKPSALFRYVEQAAAKMQTLEAKALETEAFVLARTDEILK